MIKIYDRFNNLEVEANYNRFTTLLKHYTILENDYLIKDNKKYTYKRLNHMNDNYNNIFNTILFSYNIKDVTNLIILKSEKEIILILDIYKLKNKYSLDMNCDYKTINKNSKLYKELIKMIK